MRLVPMEGDRFHLSADEAVEALRREHDRRRRRSSARPSTARTSRWRRSATPSTPSRRETGLDVPVHVDGASGAFVAPFLDPDLVWDFRLPRVASINASGHKYGLVYPGVGWVVWRDAAALPDDLIFWVNYLGDNMPTFALNFSRPGARWSRSTTTSSGSASRLRAGAGLRAGGRDAAVGRDRRARPVRAAHAGDELPVFAFTLRGRCDELQRLRRLERPARARLAGARLHVPEEPRGPGRAAGRRAARLHPRPGRHAARRPERQLPRLERQPAPVHDDSSAAGFHH